MCIVEVTVQSLLAKETITTVKVYVLHHLLYNASLLYTNNSNSCQVNEYIFIVFTSFRSYLYKRYFQKELCYVLLNHVYLAQLMDHDHVIIQTDN